jgi:Rrf2 family protein
MLRISQRCEYAIQALLELALRTGLKPVTIADIAEAQRLPRKFLAAILAQMKQVGVVASVRGTRGGYRLARPPHLITVGQVVRLLDGPVEAARAGGGDGAANSQPREGALFDVREQIRRAVEHVLDDTTLADLVETEMRRRTALVTNYCI